VTDGRQEYGAGRTTAVETSSLRAPSATPLLQIAAAFDLAGEAMKAAGLPTPATFTPEGNFTADSGRRTVGDALQRGIRFTAVAAVVDSVALGVMHELSSAGLKVPDDVSVTGFDDVDALPGLDLGPDDRKNPCPCRLWP
jgi:ABC-type sugar transport system substrate-binding protein